MTFLLKLIIKVLLKKGQFHLSFYLSTINLMYTGQNAIPVCADLSMYRCLYADAAAQ